MSENKTEVKARIVSAEDGSIKVVFFSAPTSPPLLGAKASGAKNAPVEDVTVAESGAEAPLDESILKKDLAAEEATAAETVDSDRAKAMFAAPNAVFWSKLARSTDPPAAPNGVTTNAPVLKPVIEDAPALEPVTAGGAPLPSIKELPEETPAPADIFEWTTPSKSRRNNERKGASAPIDCSNGYGALLGTGGNEGIGTDTGKAPSKGATFKPKKVKPKTPKTATPKTANPKMTTTATPKGSVSASGWFSWPKLCWHNVLCTVFVCLIAASATGGYAYFSHGSDGLLPSIGVPDTTALPTLSEVMVSPAQRVSMELRNSAPKGQDYHTLRLVHEGGKDFFVVVHKETTRWVLGNWGTESFVRVVSQHVFASGCSKPAASRAMMFDIGANGGYYGLLALANGCRATFFEPQLGCVQLIRTQLFPGIYRWTSWQLPTRLGPAVELWRTGHSHYIPPQSLRSLGDYIHKGFYPFWFGDSCFGFGFLGKTYTDFSADAAPTLAPPMREP
eukprot:CAMPEP_0185353632 /NCGR_PEP_ID=MMETSP1364-20130426/4674_1 /TAXON_ID=38817 /ORGANISM="Gephyrocapsa oceanica, Strain RCC1303" /LENGTH=504 /DNA_ID=CAMNT_0027953263 /DNA_START=40 /DNA_END=1552 /DNA_ORIENTATION=+